MTDQATIGGQGFVDIRQTQGEAASPLSDPSLYVSRATLVAALQDNSNNPGPGDPTTYTDAVVAHMTMSDLTYAVRQLYDAAGIK